MTTNPETQTLQQAINKAVANGPATLSLEPRTYHCGMLRLPSGIHLHLPEGCCLKATNAEADFPVIGSTYNETGEIRALLFAENAGGITLSGKGTIEGAGSTPLRWQEASNSPFRPETILFRDCREVHMRDLTVRHSSFWTIHLLRCDDVRIEGLSIRNRLDRINTDGIDPDGCRRVHIRDCDIEAGDDCIVIKSTEGDAVEDISIENCRLRTTCAALKVGTETFGSFTRIRFANCSIEDSEMAFGIFLKDGGSIDDVLAENLTIDSPGEFPLFIDHTPRFDGESKEGRLGSISLRDLRITSPGRLFVQGGYQTSLEHLQLDRIQWRIPYPLPLAQRGKPPGSARSRPPARETLPQHEAFQLCLANIDDLRCTRLSFLTGDGTLPQGRGLLYAEATSGSFEDCAFPPVHPECSEPLKQLHCTQLSLPPVE